MNEIVNFIKWRQQHGGDVASIIANWKYYFEKLNS